MAKRAVTILGKRRYAPARARLEALAASGIPNASAAGYTALERVGR